MKILVGCEESQAVTIELRKLGHEAFSCDLQECSGGHPEWHLNMDVFEAIKLRKWDLGIFFPTCTYLTVTANRAYKDQPKSKSGALVGAERREAREDAVDFFMRLVNCGIPKIAIENPIGVMSTRFRKPDQIIQPWQFGDKAVKKTCLWLKDLPKLEHTDIVEPEYVIYNSKSNKSGKSKYPLLWAGAHSSKDRSKTFPGIAKAMAEQWTKI
jgi:hypothetical protein